MGNEAEKIDVENDDDLFEGLLDDEPENESEDDTEQESESDDDLEQDESESEDDDTVSDELTVSLDGSDDDEVEHQSAPQWAKSLRKDFKRINNEKHKLEIENQKLKAQLDGTAEKPEPIGERPTLEDHNYDEESFSKALLEWTDKKRQADEAENQRQQARQQADEDWKNRLNEYESKKSELKQTVSDFSDSEDLVMSQFNQVQQGITVQGADNPALLMYALGKSPKLVKELSGITDPVKFAVRIGKIEKGLKVQPQRKPPPPEKKVTQSKTVTNGSSKLDRLREQASRTGDFTKVIQYNKRLARMKSKNS